MPNETKNRPVHEIRYRSVKTCVWRNETRNGPMFNVTFARLYRDGEEWKQSSSFNAEDLPTLAKAVIDAHSWIHEHAERPLLAAGERTSRSNRGNVAATGRKSA